MRIVDLDEFLLLPDGIVFLKCNSEQPFGLSFSDFEDLEIKTGTMLPYGDYTGDFCSKQITHELVGADDNTIERMYKDSQVNVFVDFYYGGRDGCFSSKQLFAVYEKGDVHGLINVLTESLEKAYD